VQLVWLSQSEATFQSRSFENRMSRLRKITRNSGEKTTAVDKLRLALKSASAKSLVNDRSQVRAVTCHLNDDADKRQASEQSKRINRVKLHGAGVGAKRRRRTNDVIILSSSSSSPSSFANFHVTANERNSIKKQKKNVSRSRVAAEGC
jgi:hypothetical protein